jgi:toxin-antitoxin system PIN domain toxin
MVHLLDINILIALVDPAHVHHQRSRIWFFGPSVSAWATCPIVENGFVRILSQPVYPGFGGSVSDARDALQVLTSFPGHQFWKDEVSICDSKVFSSVTSSKNLTDQYLLALAVGNGGKFATLDERIKAESVTGGAGAFVLVP